MSAINSIIPVSCRLGEFCVIGKDVVIGGGVTIWHHANLYGCELADGVMVGSYSEIQNDVVVGEDSRVQSHSFLPSGTTIGKRCFISHFFCGVNDKFSNEKVNYNSDDWGRIEIGDDVIIGSSVTMFPVKVGNGAIVGANSLVTKDIGENEIWYGSPARFIKIKS